MKADRNFKLGIPPFRDVSTAGEQFVQRSICAESAGTGLQIGWRLMGTVQKPGHGPNIILGAPPIPTPRWTTYDAAFYGMDLPKGVPVDQQERAYTSPIWYTP